MCLIVPSRVVAVQADQAEIELPDGQRATVSLALAPDVGVGDYVLVDRGVVLKTLDAAEAETILALYAELAEFDFELNPEPEPEPAPDSQPQPEAAR